MASADIVVAGAGSNSLTTACYLAKAGLSVTVLERRGHPVPDGRASNSAGGISRGWHDLSTKLKHAPF